jgi:tetratricopeptide (TPR) repeat protein
MRSIRRVLLVALLASCGCRRAASLARTLEAPATPAAPATPVTPPANATAPIATGDGRVEKEIRRESYDVEIREGTSAHVDLYHKASAALDRGDYAAARALYEEAHRLEPDRPESLVGMGTCMLDQRRITEARALFAEAAAMDARSSMARIGLGSALYLDKQYGDAARAYDAALAIDGNSADAHWGAATSYSALGNREVARMHALRFLELAPSSALAPRARQIAAPSP